MIVQHNLTAMNSNRMLGLTTASQAKSTEKLSSGYKINRAADDAAGLSISEKMRKQIRGLTQASSNAQDGISCVQTAEGALTEVHDMLQRMNELAVKAANGTMSEDDRSYVQNEIDQLVTEIDRVSLTTKFNETYLLAGEAGVDDDYTGAATAMEEALANVEKHPKAADDPNYDALDAIADELASEGTASIALDSTALSGGTGVTLGNYTLVETIDMTDADQKAAAEAGLLFDNKDDFISTIKTEMMSASADIKNISLNADGNLRIDLFAGIKEASNVSLQVGADTTRENKIEASISHLSARGLGINGLRVDGPDSTNADEAVNKIADAIQKVSTQRSALGAVQNRLEHTINNLDNVVENTTAAEASIRDTDMATEMVRYSNNNILAQAGQSMLAQANQANQGVLSLLG